MVDKPKSVRLESKPPPSKDILPLSGSDIEEILKVIGKKDAFKILLFLRDVGIAHFNEIRKVFGLNPKRVSELLNDLIRVGLVQRGSSYKLTERGVMVLLGLDFLREKLKDRHG